MPAALSIAFVVAMLLFLAGLTGHAIYTLLLARSSRSWEPTEAEVLGASVGRSRDEDGDVSYGPKLRYRYERGGRSYVGDRLSYTPLRYTSSAAAEQALSGVSSGDSVIVHVNPRNPGQAVYRPGAHWTSYCEAAALLGLTGLVAGLLLQRGLPGGH